VLRFSLKIDRSFQIPPKLSKASEKARQFIEVTSTLQDAGSKFNQTKNLRPFILKTILENETTFDVWSYAGSLTVPGEM
jgi:Eukaryotic-type carbonic anhydrase